MNLEEASTEQLVQELMSRELVLYNGLLPSPLYKQRSRLGSLVCVDGCAVRKRDGLNEAMAIVRGTGAYAGRLCLVGGIVAKHERVEDALQRHFRHDIGCEIEVDDWLRPASVRQYRTPDSNGQVPEGWLPEPSKEHNFASVYIVRLVNEDMIFGEKMGGREALTVKWFSLTTMPAESEFGYGQGVIFRHCLEQLA